MFPLKLTRSPIQLYAAGFDVALARAPLAHAVTVHTNATLSQKSITQTNPGATVCDLIAWRADFEANSLAIKGLNFATHGVSPGTAFEKYALAHIDNGSIDSSPSIRPLASNVAVSPRRAFGRRVNCIIRPMNASYRAQYGWHSLGKAIDVVSKSGVNAVNRDRIQAPTRKSGPRVIEMLRLGDGGHANQGHATFARYRLVNDRIQPIEGDEDRIVNVAQVDAPFSPAPVAAEASRGPTPALASAAKAPPQWNVIAGAEWRATRGVSL